MTVTEVVEVAGAAFAIGGVILAAGAALARLATHEARLNKLERGAEDQGRRIGDAQAELLALKESRTVEREYQRRLTGAHKEGE